MWHTLQFFKPVQEFFLNTKINTLQTDKNSNNETVYAVHKLYQKSPVLSLAIKQNYSTVPEMKHETMWMLWLYEMFKFATLLSRLFIEH